MVRDAHGWCSLRLRFDARELELLKGAEQVRGAALAHTPRPEVLRTALSLAKAGHKVGSAQPGGSVSLEESEIGLLSGALRFAAEEVRWATKMQDGQDGQEAVRRNAVMNAFPELVSKGVWRGFGLVRELDTLAERLEAPLRAQA